MAARRETLATRSAAERAAERVTQRKAKEALKQEEARTKFERATSYHKQESAAQIKRSERIAATVQQIPDDDPLLVPRLEVLRRQIPEDGPITPEHCMVVQGIEVREGFCISCGAALDEPAVVRCPYCIKAYRMVYQEQLREAIRREQIVYVDADFTLDD